MYNRPDSETRTTKRKRIFVHYILPALTAGIAIVAGGLVMEGCSAVGQSPKDQSLSRVRSSPNWKDGKFVNRLAPDDIPFLSTTWRFIKGQEHTEPEGEIETVSPTFRSAEALRDSPLQITWFGHSSTLVEIDGYRILIDPVWSDRVSPISIVGPKRFFPPPVPLSDLPMPHAVVISHDHYDHLDKETVIALGKRGADFIVPLGVGAHLVHWGVIPERITELDWWESAKVGQLTLVAAPGRHFSGRSPVGADRDKTLWAGWALIGTRHRVYYSGDTAMFPGFKEIGDRFGPFDVTMIEIGAYDMAWRDYHIGPEQAVTAHLQLRGDVLLPVHWGTFNLALHTWTEPAERLLVAAEKAGVTVALPRPGGQIEGDKPLPSRKWWPDIPWQSAEEAPLVSSKLGHSDSF